jgi:two-component system chemotaxis response regulator CheY
MGQKIMIVDDAAFMRMMISDTLAKNGYTEIIEAPDGQKAFELYQVERPDLVIMDITMPNMSGIESLKAIRNYDKNAKVVMCSAMGQESMVVDAIRYGALDFIVKPFKPDRILQTVTKILG